MHSLSPIFNATRNNLVTIAIEPVDHPLSPYMLKTFHAKPVTVILFFLCEPSHVILTVAAAGVLPNSSYLENLITCSILESNLGPPAQADALSIMPQSRIYFYQANAN